MTWERITGPTSLRKITNSVQSKQSTHSAFTQADRHDDLESFFLSEHPADPVLSNCPPFVIEGDDVTGSCQTSGSPPAVVTWVISGTTDSKVLVLRNVSRSLDGQNYTCNQYWGGVNSNWRTTTYSVQVHCESVCLPCSPSQRWSNNSFIKRRREQTFTYCMVLTTCAISNGMAVKACTSGGVYVPCIYMHAR